jgi:tRNA pseudouridine32 synthase/23S rRNA pseudouridine746 synthase
MHIFTVILFSQLLCFLDALQRPSFQFRADKHGLQLSFIDSNKKINSEMSLGYNSGLGNENLIYADDDIIVVNKPPHCSTAPGFRETDSLATRIGHAFHLNRIDKMIVHRLDYATSGVVVFARNDQALTNMHKQFRLRNCIYKRYSAVVKGYLSNFEGEISLPLSKQIDNPPLCCVDSISGKGSDTSWLLIARHGGRSHVHLLPHTGR